MQTEYTMRDNGSECPDCKNKKREDLELLNHIQKQDHKKGLQDQMREKEAQRRKQQQEDLNAAKKSSGFDFECYNRDKKIKDEQKKTKEYLAKQQ